MTFEHAPTFLQGTGITTSELVLAAIVLPLIVGAFLGFRRELAAIAAAAGAIALLFS